MAGRKPVPTKLKIMRGNPGKRALPKDEPMPEAVCPEPPDILCERGKAHWIITVKELFNAKVMTNLDIDALTIYCSAYVRWMEANEKIATEGVIIDSPSGYQIQSPYLSISNKAIDQMKAFLTEFGMTPSSRTRVRTVNSKPTDDGWGDA